VLFNDCYVIISMIEKWRMTNTICYIKENDDMKKALITGITGQDGSYLAEFLLEKGYEVHGITRRISISNTQRIDHLLAANKIKIHDGDLSDGNSIVRIINEVQPDEIYNLAAQSHVGNSFDVPIYTGDVDALGVLRILDAVHQLGLDKKTRIYQASTSELYGQVEEVPQNENTPFHPFSPYAVAKQYGFWMMREYRDAYGQFAANGILFNHESERRGETFVTRKITLAAARISQGLQECLYLGNLDSKRDWGYAKDYVECMWLILQQDEPDDYVIATGVQHTVREFATLAFKHVGIDIEWQGQGIDEKGIDKATGKVVVAVSPDFYRPTDVVDLWGDPTKAKTKLGWNPQKTSYEDLVRIMAEHDLKIAKTEKMLKE
jgi:GDPmannose 4,6-dehydratase